MIIHGDCSRSGTLGKGKPRPQKRFLFTHFFIHARTCGFGHMKGVFAVERRLRVEIRVLRLHAMFGGATEQSRVLVYVLYTVRAT